MFGYKILISLGFLMLLFMLFKRILFNPFVYGSEKKIILWSWTKRVILVLLSVHLLYSGVERWYYFNDDIAHSDERFLDMDYAKNIEIEVYVMDKQKLTHLFEGLPPEHADTTLSKKQLNVYPHSIRPYCYLVYRVKNTGDKMVWGHFRPITKYNGFSVNLPPLPGCK